MDNLALYTVDQVRHIDRIAIERCRSSGASLMHRAAQAAFAALRRRWPEAHHIRVLAGTGNNGGDAYLLAALAHEHGLRVELHALGDSIGEDAIKARSKWIALGQPISTLDDAIRAGAVDVVVDGLFGSGLSRAIEGDAAELIVALNARGSATLALDVPSGLDANSGVATGPVLRADATISFVGWKRGLFTADAADLCGVLELATLAIPADAYAGIDADANLLDTDLIQKLSARKRNVNKGTFGHVLAIGGDEGMAGAVRLCAEAALRSGAGMVSVATRLAHVSALNAARPELMARAVDGPQSIAAMLERASTIALGPGLGQAAWGHALWDSALRADKPIVIDADALNLLAEHPCKLPGRTVLTPHPGEAARLLRLDIGTIQRDRFAAARAIARTYAATVVLKGAGSIIAAEDGRVAVCRFGNPGMASAGMGDVLTGIIAGLLAQGLSVWDSARIGALAHARAGDLAAGTAPRGMIASDLFVPLRRLLNGQHA
ncbi:MAG: NAD(P)H-hydrate dehydratase [Dokdonella sp.]